MALTSQPPYAHDALEPHIDARTMEIHHGKHHAGYTSKLNAAVEGTDLEGKDIETFFVTTATTLAYATTAGLLEPRCSGTACLPTAGRS